MKNLLLMSLLTALVACASTSRPVEDVRVNMDKDQVLRTAGSPKYTYRSEDRDHWVYFFESGDRLFTQTITFDGGKVIQVGHSKAKDNSTQELENASSMEEYERKARAIQKAKSATKFKSVGD